MRRDKHGLRGGNAFLSSQKAPQNIARDIETLRSMLSYDPETGFLVWKVNRKRVRAGDRAGSLRRTGYIVIGLFGELHFAHRLAVILHTGVLPAGLVDHIDGDKANNKIENLRVVCKSGNAQNMKAARVDNKLGLLGVSRSNAGKPYFSRIQIDGKQKYLGAFNSPHEAHQAYLNAKRRIHEANTL